LITRGRSTYNDVPLYPETERRNAEPSIEILDLLSEIRKDKDLSRWCPFQTWDCRSSLHALKAAAQDNLNEAIMKAQTKGRQIITDAVKKAQRKEIQAAQDINVWSEELQRSNT
jgi:hypothetical protein